MESFLSIGGIAIRVRTSDARLDVPFDEPTARFVVSPRTPDLDVVVSVLENYTPPAGELLFDSGGVWKSYDEGARYRIECRSIFSGELPYKIALVDRDLVHVEVQMRMIEQGIWPALQYPLDELLVNALLAQRGGVEIHSCGIVDRAGNGYVFAGNSGAGKTTTARLWENVAAEIVSDDRVIVRREDGGWFMYGTPWHGEAEICSASRAPLRRIFLLEQATDNAVVPVSGGHAVARLISCAFPPFHDRAQLGKIVGTLAQLVTEVPVVRLEFAKDERVVDFVRRSMEVAA